MDVTGEAVVGEPFERGLVDDVPLAQVVDLRVGDPRGKARFAVGDRLDRVEAHRMQRVRRILDVGLDLRVRRDALGEVNLLGFTYEQNHNAGILFIAYAGARQIRKVSGTKAPLYAAIKEGRRLGRAAAKIAHQDIAALMREDIEAARARLGIGRPEIYRQCLAILESEGVAREQLTLGEAQAA